jgi:hypothetical protein
MHAILKQLQKLADDELMVVSEAIDLELERRLDAIEGYCESARQRARDRQQSYRRETGAGAPPISAVGLGRSRRAA